MNHLLLIAVCGAAGAVIRYGVGDLAQRQLGDGFPYGTLIVNVAGCFLLGVVGELATAATVSDAAHKAIAVGLLGALTTFSTFGHETLRRLESGQWLLAGGNVAANVLIGLLAVWSGIRLVRYLAGG